MNRISRFAALVVIGLLVVAEARAFDPVAQKSYPVAAQGTLQAAFAPWDDIEGLILTSLESAKKQVLVQAYLLTSKKIANALIAAHRRGVDVRVLVDAEQLVNDESSKASDLVAAGVPVWSETKYQHAHDKIIVIDATMRDPIVITGSYNFTWSAQHRNSENILIARSNPVLASQFALNWERHQQDSSPYKK
jgi:phosphatidylserine/phosphatidylglycerophosphate/cardiolipin synthase-like enzyme